MSLGFARRRPPTRRAYQSAQAPPGIICIALFSDDETRTWLGTAIGDRGVGWWVARREACPVGYMLIKRENLDHLYVLPGWQRCGIGLALLGKAKTLSPKRVRVSTFQRNVEARAFYEANGFRAVGDTGGRNEENEPDVQYVWDGPGR